MEHFATALVGIILINLLLSGDNAVVIGMAVRTLPERQKRRAILIGGLGALILRVVLTALTAILLQIPLLQAAGGLLLAWVTYRLLVPGEGGGPAEGAAEITFSVALRTIIIADLTMSLDNVLAIGAAAGGDLLLLLLGLAISMGIILAGGALVATLLGRLPWLVYVGAGVLLLVAGSLLAADPLVAGLTGGPPWLAWAAATTLGAIVGAALRRRGARPATAREPATGSRDILQA